MIRGKKMCSQIKKNCKKRNKFTKEISFYLRFLLVLRKVRKRLDDVIETLDMKIRTSLVPVADSGVVRFMRLFLFNFFNFLLLLKIMKNCGNK